MAPSTEARLAKLERVAGPTDPGMRTHSLEQVLEAMALKAAGVPAEEAWRRVGPPERVFKDRHEAEDFERHRHRDGGYIL